LAASITCSREISGLRKVILSITDPENKNPYAFTGTTDAGETISWSGFFYLTPLRSEGELKLFNFTLNKYAPLYQDLVRFEVRDGTIAVDMKYRLEISATNRVPAVDNLAYELRNFKLAAPGQSNNLLDVPLFSLTGGNVDLQNRTATLDSVQLTDAKAFLERDTNAAVNVVEISKPAGSATNAPGGILFLLRSVTNAVAMLLNSTNEWTGTVRSVMATNCELHLVDHANPRTARLDLSEITLDAKNHHAVITGRRGRAILTWDAGVEAAVEQLPLEEPVWKTVMQERKEQYLVTTLHAETQPRLTLTQRGHAGRLVVRVRLERL